MLGSADAALNSSVAAFFLHICDLNNSRGAICQPSRIGIRTHAATKLLPTFLQVDPALEGPTLPQKGNDEFKPFVRRLPEFKFWCVSLCGFSLMECAINPDQQQLVKR